jgi:FlaA1/EpsC-like NDP-sugar epimerase
MISTDKAVNPSNVMGTTKRIAEIYIQSLKNNPINKSTRFITTRFGNVLGSNGSVIPRFKAQIQKGGPITVTHPEITRYFMTIPEAVHLVLEAGTMGIGGEIFIFDMGEPVKITDLALKMIKLAGLQPEKDIKIVYTGLRPGEKLYEELLNDGENTMPTYHEKIKISQVIDYDYEQVLADIDELLTLNKWNDVVAVVNKMKEIVPEFISKNSQFEELDNNINESVLEI